jgi:hypothetical protein
MNILVLGVSNRAYNEKLVLNVYYILTSNSNHTL